VLEVHEDRACSYRSGNLIHGFRRGVGLKRVLWARLVQFVDGHGLAAAPDPQRLVQSWAHQREQDLRSVDSDRRAQDFSALALEAAARTAEYSKRRDTWQKSVKRLNAKLRELLHLTEDPFQQDADGNYRSRFASIRVRVESP